MKKVAILHGYNGFPLVLEWLREELKKMDYNVVMPMFPKAELCRYKYWKSVLDEYIKFFDEDTIVVAHSIGNPFIFKYLNEKNIKIKLYIGLAGFCDVFSVDGKDVLNEALADFPVSDDDINNFKKSVKYRYSIYSDNDHVVPFYLLENCYKKLDSNQILIKNIGHMGKKSGLEKLPEIISIISKY